MVISPSSTQAWLQLLVLAELFIFVKNRIDGQLTIIVTLQLMMLYLICNMNK